MANLAPGFGQASNETETGPKIRKAPGFGEGNALTSAPLQTATTSGRLAKGAIPLLHFGGELAHHAALSCRCSS